MPHVTIFSISGISQSPGFPNLPYSPRFQKGSHFFFTCNGFSESPKFSEFPNPPNLPNWPSPPNLQNSPNIFNFQNLPFFRVPGDSCFLPHIMISSKPPNLPISRISRCPVTAEPPISQFVCFRCVRPESVFNFCIL